MVADKRRHLSARGCQTCHARRRECEPGLPANTTHSPSTGTMLCQRRRQWPNNVPALGERLLSATSWKGTVLLYRVYRPAYQTR